MNVRVLRGPLVDLAASALHLAHTQEPDADGDSALAAFATR
jgi:hypothetical protein